MRSVKSPGGLTRGRGLSENQRSQWLLSMPACAEVTNAINEYTVKHIQLVNNTKKQGIPEWEGTKRIL